MNARRVSLADPLSGTPAPIGGWFRERRRSGFGSLAPVALPVRQPVTVVIEPRSDRDSCALGSPVQSSRQSTDLSGIFGGPARASVAAAARAAWLQTPLRADTAPATGTITG